MLKWLASKFDNHKSSVQPEPVLPPLSSSSALVSLSVLEQADIWRKRGNTFLADGKLEDAARCYQQGILAEPTAAACYSNFGYVLIQLGQWSGAEAMLAKAVEFNPADFDAYYLLGNVVRERGDWLRARDYYLAALSAKPDFDFCRRDLCILLAQNGQPQEARTVMDQGVAHDTESADYHQFRGNIHLAAAEYAAAEQFFLKAARLSPSDITILINLGAAQIGRRDVFNALGTYRAALALEPNNAQAHANSAAAFQLCGLLEPAIQSYREALRANPHQLNVNQNLLCALAYQPDLSMTEYVREAKQYGAKISALAKPYTNWMCPKSLSTKRALRVGFVSGDLRQHPVGYFLEGTLKCFDTHKIACFAYSNCAMEDATSARLQPLFAEWRQVANLSDEYLARQIHADRIDILVDLAGHTGHNRLSVFAWRPAPVQVAWLGYWASTGVAEIDYILVDETSVHADEAQYFSERLWFLPDTRLCFSPPVTSHPIAIDELPALRKGHITFASFQTLAKIGDATLMAWSQILSRVPTARLRLQSSPLSYPDSVAYMQKRLALASIDVDRIDLLGGTPRDAYLASYAEVDIVLDTFPFPGGTTTAEALWMGVPTVTLTGESLLARQGESILRSAGLGDWVTTTVPEYIQCVIDKIADLPKLGELRASLRTSVSRSSLFDSARFAKNLEKAFEGMVSLSSG